VRIALTRSAAGSGQLAVLDADGRMPGRGAYLCREAGAQTPARRCLASALRNGGVQRTLRARATLDDKLVESVGR
jgi:predicted RNA-binding protein YlxR (DUF448 family)